MPTCLFNSVLLEAGGRSRISNRSTAFQVTGECTTPPFGGAMAAFEKAEGVANAAPMTYHPGYGNNHFKESDPSAARLAQPLNAEQGLNVLSTCCHRQFLTTTYRACMPTAIRTRSCSDMLPCNRKNTSLHRGTVGTPRPLGRGARTNPPILAQRP